MAYAMRSAGHPGALGLTLAVNAGAVLALIAWNPNIVKDFIPVLPTTNYPEATVPPVEPPPPEDMPKVKQRQPPTQDPPFVETQRESTWTFDPTPPPPRDLGKRAEPPPPPPPPVEIVRVPARMITSAGEMQPPYPPALQRAEVEGSIVVRVLVGADGRPTDIMLVRADDPGFFAATRAWGLRHWRFRPATEDGRAVAGSHTLTVRFTLDA